MKVFKKAAVIGTGLIGGSIALALKKKHLAREVVGVSRRKSSLSTAKRIGAIDRGSQDISIIKGADLVILATPVGLIKRFAPRVRRLINDRCVVIDVGSTKQEIVSSLSREFPRYIGTHPLAGSEKRGVANADATIFKGRLCILTPTASSNLAALARTKELWQALGARVVKMSAASHDLALSLISHLPHAVAFSLIDTIPAKHLKLASSGLKDATRIAASDSRLWVDIFLSNRKNAASSINALQKNLSKLRSAIIKNDRKSLKRLISRAKNKRDSLQ
ncbi:prephenate dehydrogenase [Candidatus Omnitrophota bacterium]